MSKATAIRVLVVDDSVTVRKHVIDILEEDPAFIVVAEAGDGRQAIELCEQHRPDVVTMDLELPVMSGLAATEWIMAYCPTPILILSGATELSGTRRAEAYRSYDAIAAGAVDVLPKATAISDSDWESRLKFTLRVASRVKVLTHVRGKHVPSISPRTTSAASVTALPSARTRVVAVGASTGGPAAVRRLLMDLPRDFPAPILLVMHVGAAFDGMLAEWLDAQSVHRVAIATDGAPLFDGPPRISIAPADKHMLVRGGKIHLAASPERHSCRPSVDVLFESLAPELGAAAVGVLLTGMGRDGAAGLLALRRAGAPTIVQDEATSVVYGMPRAAVELGAATAVLPLDRIASELTRLTSSQVRR
jgi:two-component system chemotaxis response regulator CheB